MAQCTSTFKEPLTTLFLVSQMAIWLLIPELYILQSPSKELKAPCCMHDQQFCICIMVHYKMMGVQATFSDQSETGTKQGKPYNVWDKCNSIVFLFIQLPPNICETCYQPAILPTIGSPFLHNKLRISADRHPV